MPKPRTAALALVAGLLVLGAVPAQERRPVEELRTVARAKVGAMRKEFETELKRALVTLRTARPESSSPRHREVRDGLVLWASVFGDDIIAALGTSDSTNVQHHLLDVLIEADAQDAAPDLAALLGKKDAEFDRRILETLGRLGNREVAPSIRARATKATPPAVLADALTALARLRDPEARSLSRQFVRHEDPAVRISAIQALVLTSNAPKEDAARVMAIARDDVQPEVKGAAIAALGAFPDDLDVLRLLHDTLGSDDARQVRAALEALERVGSKELSRPYVLKVVQKTALPAAVREVAARLLLAFEDSRGVLALYKDEIAEARRDPKNRNLQRLVAQKLMRIGAFEVALDYLERARDPKASARSQFTIYVEMARCHARLGNFSEARRQMKRAGYKNLSAFADDPDFEAMRRSAEFADLFRKDA